MLAPGTIVDDKYEVERVLGRGGVGVVVAARHRVLNQGCALKLLLAEHTERPGVVERFLREARASARLRSPHVCRVFDAGRFADGTPYLAMEHLTGSDLAQILHRDGPLAVPVAIDLVLQACEAIAEAHAAGIVHRDLKPGNLFVTTDLAGAPFVKVLDFGISKVEGDVVGDLTQTQTVMGSPSYMSPEQLRASRNVDARTDIWALGVVLYQMLAARLPFVGETLTHLAVVIATEPFPPIGRPDCVGLEPVIARCLAKRPEDRFATIVELAAALAPFADARSAGRLERVGRVTGTGFAAAAPASGALPAAPVSGALPAAPVSGALPAAPIVEERTTLSSAISATATGARPRRRGVAIAGATVLALGAALAIWMAVDANRGAASRPARGAPAAPAPPPSAEAATTPTQDAAAAPAAVIPDAAPPPVAIDAAPPAPAVTDRGKTRDKTRDRSKVRRPPAGGSNEDLTKSQY